MSRILIIDDEKDLVMLLKDSLEAKGHKVLVAYNGKDGIKKAQLLPDLVILDIMMPDLNGFEVCRKIRDAALCPIIFLSAKQSEADKVKGLASGGDDYLIKPFSLRELMARIDAHLRREKRALYINSTDKRTHLSFGNLLIDLKGRQVTIKGKAIILTRREFDIVELLSLHPGQTFSKDQIYEKVWGYDAEGDSSTVTEHIKNIRGKFAKEDHNNDYIKTVWGIGYKWKKII